MKRSAIVLCTILWGAACAVPREPAPSAEAVDLSTATLVDLSHAYGDDTLYWPTSPSAFELEELAYGPAEGGYFYSAYALSTPEHGGTHLDAPIHFAEGGARVADVPLSQLVAPGVVIDMSAQAAADPDARLARSAVEDWEAEHGPIPEGAVVLLRTGWEARWPDALAYLGDDTPGDAGNLHFPSYGEEAARLLVEERRVGALGIDTASIDYGQSEDFIVHRVAAQAGVVGLENVANLDELPVRGFWVLALPLKIERGSGAPVRIVAVVPSGADGDGGGAPGS